MKSETSKAIKMFYVTAGGVLESEARQRKSTKWGATCRKFNLLPAKSLRASTNSLSS